MMPRPNFPALRRIEVAHGSGEPATLGGKVGYGWGKSPGLLVGMVSMFSVETVSKARQIL